MQNWLINVLLKLLPSKGGFKLYTPAKFRALVPTWPVVISIALIGLAISFADQGRAVLKFAARGDFSETFWSFLILYTHSCIMMLTALMLSAVTRRNYLDAVEKNSNEIEPVDASIALRVGFSYLCGVMLPLLFVTLCVIFEFGLGEWNVGLVLAVSALAGWLFNVMARKMYPALSARYARINAIPDPTNWQKTSFRIRRFALLLTAPERRFAQGFIVFSATALTLLAWVYPNANRSIPPPGFLSGAWLFFLVFLGVHITFRLFQAQALRMHQGHTARYIIIDNRFTFVFNVLRTAAILLILCLLWVPEIVDKLGPLGVGLIGTLWITLFLSAIVEAAAHHSGAEASRTRTRARILSFKLAIFAVIILVLAADSLLAVFEFFYTLEFSLALIANVLFLVAIGAALIRRKHIWGDFNGLFKAINRLPTATYLSPILFLSLGEAHHIHRVDPVPNLTIRSHYLDKHAELWIEARKKNDGAQEIPAIIILAEGGGIRAGAHTGYFLSHLDEAIRDACNQETPSGEASNSKPSFCREDGTRLLDHTYAISGVSGGAVGSAVYLAAVQKERQGAVDSNHRIELIKDTLSEDYMSTLFAGLFASDILTTVLPAQLPDRFIGWIPKNRDQTDTASAQTGRGIYDRADFFEERLSTVFERSLQSLSEPSDQSTNNAPGDCSTLAQQKAFDLPLEVVAYCAGSRDSPSTEADPGPAVFFPTFYETGGFQMAAASVDIGPAENEIPNNGFCGSVPTVQQMLGYGEPDHLETDDPRPANSNVRNCDLRTQTLPLSTAAHISARFPVASPSAVIETRFPSGQWKRHYFVDGGYMDNSGALAASQALSALRVAAVNEGASLNIIVLHLYALNIPENAEDLAPTPARASKQDEFLSVPSAVLKARGAASRAPVQMLCNALAGEDEATRSKCDTIFQRKTISGHDLDRFDPINGLTSDRTGPVLGEYLDRIDLQCPLPTSSTDEHEAGDDCSVKTSWIPVPLEVAANDHQDNAITALLGWSLLTETSDQIDSVMHGAADLVSQEISERVAIEPNVAGQVADETGISPNE